MVDITLTNAGLILIVLGFVLAFVAMILVAVRSRGSDGNTRSAGILLIGPIPIIFGSDKESVRILMVLAVVLIVIVLVIMLIPTFMINR